MLFSQNEARPLPLSDRHPGHTMRNIVAASATVLLLATTAFAASPAREADPIFSSQLTISDPRIGGFSGAGVGLLQPVSGIYTNPAFPNAYNTYNTVRRFLISGGYGRDSLFEKHVLPVSASCYLGKGGTIGLMYRYVKASDDRRQHEATLNYSAKLFDKSTTHGAVDVGVNLRYERADWDWTGMDTLWSRRITQDTAVRTGGFDWIPRTIMQDNRAILDVGFFQPYLADRLDFGLTISNIVGYVWRDSTSGTGHTSKDALSDTLNGQAYVTEFTDTLSYRRKTDSGAFWLPSMYRRLTVGIAFHTPVLKEKVIITIPADLVIQGMSFRSGTPKRLGVRTGLEATIVEHFMVRFGYGWAPRTITVHDFYDKKHTLNQHIISGGAGVRIRPFWADAYVGKNQWGFGLGVVL